MKSVRLPSIPEIIILLLLFLAVVFSFQTIFNLPIQLALFISWFLVIAQATGSAWLAGCERRSTVDP